MSMEKSSSIESEAPLGATCRGLSLFPSRVMRFPKATILLTLDLRSSFLALSPLHKIVEASFLSGRSFRVLL